MSAKSEESPQRMRESGKGYQDILESIEEGYFEVDLSGNLTYCNDAMCRIADLPREELIGMNNRDYTTPETAKAMYEAFSEIYRTGRSAKVMDYEIIRKDGVRRTLELSASLIRDAGGEPAGYRGIVRDVTERKRALDALRESEEKFRMLSEKSPNMIYINQGGRVVYANKECEKVTGYTREEFYAPDFNFMSLIAPESLATVKANYERHSKGEEVPPYEYTIISKDGRRIHGLHTTKLINLEDAPAILGIITDVTERKIAEEEIRQRTEDVALINEVNHALNSGAKLEEVIQLISDTIKEMYSPWGVVGAGVFLLSEDGERLLMQNLPLSEKVVRQIEKLTGKTLPKFTLNLAEGPLHREVLEVGRTRVLDTRGAIQQWMREFVTDAWIGSSAVRRQLRKLAPQVRKLLGYKYSVVLPLQTDGETIGLMEISSETPFTGSDIGRLEMMSSQLTTAIKRKQTEDALRESEARYRSIIDSTPMGIHTYRLDKEDRLIFEGANRAADEILGVDHTQFIGKTIEEAFPGAIGTDILGNYRRLAHEGGTWTKEDSVYEDEQISGAFEVHAFQPSPGKISAMFSDVTERRRAEEALRLTQFSVDHVSDAA
ncbi:MAG: PAS domain S-box protein, partial [Fidelibacterota bacterium]